MENNKFKFVVKNNSILREEIMNNISRKYYRHLKSINAIFLVNGLVKKPHEEVHVNDVIEIIANEEKKELNWPYVDMELDIRFENEHYLVVYKPEGLLTIPTKSEPISLYQIASQYLNQKEIHILNRLDKDTRGLMVIAKDRYAAYLLQPTHLHMERRYLCMVYGNVIKSGKISNYIEKIEGSNKRVISENEIGKLAISNYNVIKNYKDKTLLEFVLETGRTHQIRLHCSYIGHPILGDKIYGVSDEFKLHLASYFVCFVDPFTKEKIVVKLEETPF